MYWLIALIVPLLIGLFFVYRKRRIRRLSRKTRNTNLSLDRLDYARKRFDEYRQTQTRTTLNKPFLRPTQSIKTHELENSFEYEEYRAKLRRQEFEKQISKAVLDDLESNSKPFIDEYRADQKFRKLQQRAAESGNPINYEKYMAAQKLRQEVQSDLDSEQTEIDGKYVSMSNLEKSIKRSFISPREAKIAQDVFNDLNKSVPAEHERYAHTRNGWRLRKKVNEDLNRELTAEDFFISEEVTHPLARYCFQESFSRKNKDSRKPLPSFLDKQDKHNLSIEKGHQFEERIQASLKHYLKNHGAIKTKSQYIIDPNNRCDFVVGWKDSQKITRAIILECKYSDSNDALNNVLEGIEQLKRYKQAIKHRHKNVDVDLLVVITNFPPLKDERQVAFIENTLILNAESVFDVFVDGLIERYKSTTTN